MKKKIYLKPTIEVHETACGGLLAASGRNAKGSSVSVSKGNVKGSVGDKNPWETAGAKGYSQFEDKEGE